MEDTLAQRYWAKVDVRGPDECWPWTGGTSKGYGKLWDGIAMRRAHRIGWRIHHGKDPGAEEVRHTCDNPPCQNPAHWVLGSRQDNMDDMATRGRAKYVRGQRHGRTVLTDDQVLEMRALHAAGAKQVELAARYGTTQATVSNVIRRKTWGHI